MKDAFQILLSIIVGAALSLVGLKIFLSSTNKELEKVEISTKTAKKKTINIDHIIDSYKNWNNYTKENIDLMATFNPIDSKGTSIDKETFLTSLATGDYIAVKSENQEALEYQLVALQASVNKRIKKSIVSKARIAHQYFKMEGEKLPVYDFVDLDGKSHNKAVKEGKITVLKSWFISCKICVEEFPELNELVDHYKDDNIQFISLAFNEKEKLKKFLETKPFKYVTIPNQKAYMSKDLKLKQYPTHIIVDSNGVILKMVNNVNTLTTELERIVKK